MNLRLGLAPNKFTLISGIICQIWRRDTDKYTQHTERKNLGDKLLKLEKHDKCRCFHNSCFCGYKAKLTNNISITTIITNRFCRLKYATIEGDVTSLFVYIYINYPKFLIFFLPSQHLSEDVWRFMLNREQRMVQTLQVSPLLNWTSQQSARMMLETQYHKKRRKLLAFKKIFFFSDVHCAYILTRMLALFICKVY